MKQDSMVEDRPKTMDEHNNSTLCDRGTKSRQSARIEFDRDT